MNRSIYNKQKYKHIKAYTKSGHQCRGCKIEKKGRTHRGEDLGKVLGMNMESWWMGLRGQIGDWRR